MPILKIFSLLRSKFANKQDLVPHRIYGSVVAQARNSAFYTHFAIPDTVIGRYDMLGLHVFLINNRLKNGDCDENDDCRVLSQKVFDLFLIDLERGLRDIGFADTSVHKRKKKLVHSYYALIDEFDTAIDERDASALLEALANRYYTQLEPPKQSKLCEKLANYMLLVADKLAAQEFPVYQNADIGWPAFTEEKT